jgi:hypothetical protein
MTGIELLDRWLISFDSTAWNIIENKPVGRSCGCDIFGPTGAPPGFFNK